MKKLYTDFNDFFTNSKLSELVGLSREDMELVWDDLEPTIKAVRHDWELLLIEETKQQRETFITRIRDIHSYLNQFNLEKVAGIGFHRWLLNKKLKKD